MRGERRVLPILEELTIATPCTASWDAMAGNDRVRHCGSCDLDVYNLSGMTRDAARKLIAANNGHLCVRLYKRHDGTVITEDCPTALARARRRVASAATLVLSLMGVSLFGLGATATARTMRNGGGEGIFSSPTLQAITALFTAKPIAPVIPPHSVMMGAPPVHVSMGTPAPLPVVTP